MLLFAQDDEVSERLPAAKFKQQKKDAGRAETSVEENGATDDQGVVVDGEVVSWTFSDLVTCPLTTRLSRPLFCGHHMSNCRSKRTQLGEVPRLRITPPWNSSWTRLKI